MVRILREWTDDHIMCCEVEIDGKAIELWWCGWEGVAAAKYANDSVQARADLTEFVVAQEQANREEQEGNDEQG